MYIRLFTAISLRRVCLALNDLVMKLRVTAL